MEQNYKEVNFKLYCNGGVRKDGKKIKKCAHYDVYEGDEPCNSCLCNFVNENSEKPINYIKGDNKNGERKDTGK